MQVVVESTQGLEHQMTITLAAEQVEQAVTAELRQRAKTLHVNGFRPGKAPITLIDRQQGEAVRHKVQNELMQQNFAQAVEQYALRPAGRVQFTPQSPLVGGDFSYQVTFEIYPQVTLQGLQDIVVERPQAEISDADIDNLSLRMRRMFATWEPGKGAARPGDRVTIDFNGTIDGESFEGGTANNFVLILGENTLVSGFDEGIIGHHIADEFTIDITFPAIYPSAEHLQGKTAQFLIRLIQVEACTLPEWDAEFLKRIGLADGKMESVRQLFRETMERELQQSIKQHVKYQVLEGLLEKHADLAIPESLIDQAAEELAEQRTKKQALPPEQLRKQARRRAALGLLINEVIEQRALEPDPAQIEQVLKKMAEKHKDPLVAIRDFLSDKKLVESVYLSLLEEQAITSLLATAVVTEKQSSFNEVVIQHT